VAGDPAAASRVLAEHPHPAEPLKLSDAQLVIAREYGFASWSQLHACVDRIAAHGPRSQQAYRADLAGSPEWACGPDKRRSRSVRPGLPGHREQPPLVGDALQLVEPAILEG
jgi:hypothetical protein